MPWIRSRIAITATASAPPIKTPGTAASPSPMSSPARPPSAIAASAASTRGTNQLIGDQRLVRGSRGQRLRLPREPIAGAAHGLDHLRTAGRAQRFAQPLHVHVDGALLDEHMVAPDPVEQLRSAVD